MSETLKKDVYSYIMIILGALLFSIGLNIFIVPLGLYSGGLIGIAQIIRTLLQDYFHLSIPAGVDIAGIINLFMNIPLFVLAYRSISRKFFVRTLVCVIVQTFFMTVITIPQTPLIQDILAACLIGGICCGVGVGLALRSHGSTGGIDILGVFFSLKYPGFSVGKLGIIINVLVFSICAYLFAIPVAIYSIIYTVCLSMSMDKVHYQNINMTAMIFTKSPRLQKVIMEEMRRGVTYWKGAGAYTDEETNILVTVISKYETTRLKKIIQEVDSKAFVIFNEGMSISGNFEKRL